MIRTQCLQSTSNLSIKNFCVFCRSDCRHLTNPTWYFVHQISNSLSPKPVSGFRNNKNWLITIQLGFFSGPDTFRTLWSLNKNSSSASGLRAVVSFFNHFSFKIIDNDSFSTSSSSTSTSKKKGHTVVDVDDDDEAESRFDLQEEKPLVAGVVDERPSHVRLLKFKNLHLTW